MKVIRLKNRGHTDLAPYGAFPNIKGSGSPKAALYVASKFAGNACPFFHGRLKGEGECRDMR